MAENGPANAGAGALLADLTPHHLTAAQFEAIATTVYRATGIDLRVGKEELVKSRLIKRLRALGLTDFEQYLAHIKADVSGQEMATMVDLLTTNKTSFFREDKHFTLLRRWLRANAGLKKIRIWSAGCSSGEEPFSIAIVLCEELPDISERSVGILATDISSRMLERAKRAVYEHDPALRDVPAGLLGRYFNCVKTDPPRLYEVRSPVRSLVHFAHLNLLGCWPMRGPFDLVFCRNVMIYFDAATRERVVRGIWQLLRPGGYLLVGHSESLLGSAGGFTYVQPAVYMRDSAE
ncbi:MAG TPA: protein-glutamate O-methyltransferase CheR [bacterium]|nr:protein-glutamate O-methyltransferase CheR [bacterium]